MEFLQQVLTKINNQYFQFEELPNIRVSRGQLKENRKAIVFGTYHVNKNEIKIHPILLDAPNYALEFVIYHEMLHYEDREILKRRKKGQGVHTKEFHQRERLFKEYDQAKIILKNLLHGHPVMSNKKALRGESLEQALADSLKHLENVLAKYNIDDDSKKGAKRGSKKNNDKVELDSHD